MIIYGRGYSVDDFKYRVWDKRRWQAKRQPAQNVHGQTHCSPDPQLAAWMLNEKFRTSYTARALLENKGHLGSSLESAKSVYGNLIASQITLTGEQKLNLRQIVNSCTFDLMGFVAYATIPLSVRGPFSTDIIVDGYLIGKDELNALGSSCDLSAHNLYEKLLIQRGVDKKIVYGIYFSLYPEVLEGIKRGNVIKELPVDPKNIHEIETFVPGASTFTLSGTTKAFDNVILDEVTIRRRQGSKLVTVPVEYPSTYGRNLEKGVRGHEIVRPVDNSIIYHRIIDHKTGFVYYSVWSGHKVQFSSGLVDHEYIGLYLEADFFREFSAVNNTVVDSFPHTPGELEGVRHNGATGARITH